MTNDQWATIDDYFADLLIPDDPALDALKASKEAGLPETTDPTEGRTPGAVTPSQGKLLYLLAKTCDARNILEIGTLGGYSTIWLARALPKDGRLITLEYNRKHAEVATNNIANAGLADIVNIQLGPALDTLTRLAEEHHEPFDLIFIDADKKNNAKYFQWALRLSHPGTLIIVDNVVRNGAVVDPDDMEPAVGGIRRMVELIAAEPRAEATAIQTVGSKGYDGLLLARVTE